MTPLVASLADLLAAQDGQTYHEVLRSSSLSLGLFAAAAGHVDTQSPHREDEVYVVVEGRAVLDVDGERTPVGPGAAAFVPAGVPHRFVDVEQDLRVLVVFAPPET